MSIIYKAPAREFYDYTSEDQGETPTLEDIAGEKECHDNDTTPRFVPVKKPTVRGTATLH